MKLYKNCFSILTYLFILTGFVLIMIFPKGILELEVNRNFTAPELDEFFKYATYLGDGWVLLIIFVVSLFVKYRYSVVVLSMTLIQLILVHINKRWFFKGLPRPKIFFEGIDIHLVDGVSMNNYNTFPSGHTATAFSVFFLLSIMVNKRAWPTLFFVLAIVTGLSRVYLMQHFIIDIYFGAIFGYLSVLLAIIIFRENKYPSLEKKLHL